MGLGLTIAGTEIQSSSNNVHHQLNFLRYTHRHMPKVRRSEVHHALSYGDLDVYR
jgi:hypothetical protein